MQFMSDVKFINYYNNLKDILKMGKSINKYRNKYIYVMK